MNKASSGDYEINDINKMPERSKTVIKKITLALIAIILGTCLLCMAVKILIVNDDNSRNNDLVNLQYQGEISVSINNDKPQIMDIPKSIKSGRSLEEYSELDNLGRCGVAFANICKDTMPGEYDERSSLGSIQPSGWQPINFWSRCHLIGYQLAAENDNEKNLITGTSRMNLSGMLPLENQIADYIANNPNNHVMLRVEPLFDGDNLVASGIHMQAFSVEDKGEGISINKYIFNYQPGHIINYADGTVQDDPDHQTYIVLNNKDTHYTGEPVSVEPAVVQGSTGSVKYIYFTDINLNNKTSYFEGAEKDGAAPTKPGVYYVKAVVAGDNWYPSAASETAILTINE